MAHGDPNAQGMAPAHSAGYDWTGQGHAQQQAPMMYQQYAQYPPAHQQYGTQTMSYPMQAPTTQAQGQPVNAQYAAYQQYPTAHYYNQQPPGMQTQSQPPPPNTYGRQNQAQKPYHAPQSMTPAPPHQQHQQHQQHQPHQQMMSQPRQQYRPNVHQGNNSHMNRQQNRGRGRGRGGGRQYRGNNRNRGRGRSDHIDDDETSTTIRDFYKHETLKYISHDDEGKVIDVLEQFRRMNAAAGQRTSLQANKPYRYTPPQFRKPQPQPAQPAQQQTTQETTQMEDPKQPTANTTKEDNQEPQGQPVTGNTTSVEDTPKEEDIKEDEENVIQETPAPPPADPGQAQVDPSQSRS